MDKSKLINNLKSLQRARSSSGAFHSYIDCMDWADAVQALLKYDASLHAEFKVQYGIAASDEELEARILYPATNKMLGIVNRAVIELQTEPTSKQPKLPPTQKVKRKSILKGKAFYLVFAAFLTLLGGIALFEYQLAREETTQPSTQKPLSNTVEHNNKPSP